MWDYLVERRIPAHEVELLQRETLLYCRGWKVRLQIYDCFCKQDAPDLLLVGHSNGGQGAW